MKILFVAGDWNHIKNPDDTYGKPSRMVFRGITETLSERHHVACFNGGNYDDLQKILGMAKDYDVVFWWPNVPNNYEKIRNVKDVAPHVMLVTSKRNDTGRYSFMELTQMTLAAKANLTFEIRKDNYDRFQFLVYDPLGCAWYKGDSFTEALEAAERRLEYLRQITRQSTVATSTSKELVLSWYFDRFKQNEYRSDREVEVPQEEKFVALVRKYAVRFHEIMKPAHNVSRFLGNASLRPMPPQVGRCSKGMPSFRKDGYVFMSQRNVNKEFLDLEHFVPTYLEDGKVYYCGENKPSVDTPIQLRLYEQLPQINYIIHSHCYIEGAPFTTKSIPCGAIEEVDEVMEALHKHYGAIEGTGFTLNLLGHGSLAFGKTVTDLEGLRYYGRQMPEFIKTKPIQCVVIDPAAESADSIAEICQGMGIDATVVDLPKPSEES